MSSLRSFVGRAEPEQAVSTAEPRRDPEALARRFAPAVRREVRRLLRASSRFVDLAVIFPGALHAIAAADTGREARRAAIELVLAGAPLKQVAEALGLAMWLRRLPPEAFSAWPAKVPEGESFARRIVNCLPRSRMQSAFWLSAVGFAAEAVHEDFAVWLAHQSVYAEPGDPRRLFAVLAAYAWFSGQPFRPAHGLMIVPWRPEISIETALCATKSWLNRIRLVLVLRPGVISDPWLEPGEAGGFTFVPLLDANQLLEEAQAMHNCADQYADRIARDRCRLFSVRRKGGARVATLEIGAHMREPGVLDITQLKARHNMPAPLEVWQAGHAWLAKQRGLRRVPALAPPPRPIDAAGWARLMEPYRDKKGGAPWLPVELTHPALCILDADLADLARRAGVSSWLFT
ncbi:MAG TPA: PcfJ domain-containing protein [Hyphomicrobiaceae bacterium]|nr:PcfJ domain-containing protein [Hyphomicrobiaceae bacterium]